MRGSGRGPSFPAIDTLAYYTLELARPAGGWGRLQQLSAQARQASEQMRDAGVPVRFMRAIFVPEDDACLYLYEAASAEDVREAARLAELAFENVVESVNDPKGLPRTANERSTSEHH